jgi:16S rRNA (uracil1498-N3)-methyltransferase
MNTFYCSNIISTGAFLSAEESAHCIRVLRLKKGDLVKLIDGKGNMFEATITSPDPKRCQLEINSSLRFPPARNFNLHIAIAPTKNIDRFEWFIEKAVEIGIDTITPLLCDRSERRILKTERLHKLIISTLKQAMVPFKPVLNELMDFRPFVASVPVLETSAYIAHCVDEEKMKLSDAYQPGKNTVILIGPEGDFTTSEIQYALELGFFAVSLGPNRLRTETAGLVACQTVNLIKG